MVRSLIALLLLLAVHPAAPAGEKFLLQNGQRVVFLGDSNTFAGHYIAYLDGYLLTRFPDQKFELINLGLPSETVSGLSEPDHPYPRPDVHERVERALTKTKPDVVVICYGMNDGIYYPFSERRLKKYQEGMKRLIGRVQKAGARVVLMTTAPYDPQPVRSKLLPASAKKFSWLAPYAGYDDVLGRYSRWLLTLRDQKLPVADAHSAINRHLAEKRKSDPKYRLSGDGIHPNETGHRLMARELLQALHAPAEVEGAEMDGRAMKGLRGQVSDLSIKQDTIRFTWLTRLPMPAFPEWATLNRHLLTVRGAGHERYELFEGDRKLGQVTRAQLAGGLDLTRFKELSTNRQGARLWKLVEQRQALLGLAWLTAVGHKRPDTPKGLPLEEAKRRAAPLELRIRKLARPMKITLRLSPLK